MKLDKSQRKNIILLVIIAVMIIPQTRHPLQVLLHKGLALFSPSVLDEDDRVVLSSYDWQLEDESGAIYNFKDAKGKVVLVNFWATWCPPCIAEMPSMEALYKTYGDKVVFLFVSDEEGHVISKFKTKNKYSFKVYTALSKYPESFDVSSIPRTFIIDKNGTIVVDKTGAADWNSKKMQNLIESLF